MKRRVLPLLILLFAVLSTSLVWVKWQRDHPTPTALDLEVRQFFVHDEYVWIDLDDGEYRPSLQERREIASHLFLLATKGTSGGENDVTTNWGQEKIVMDAEKMNDFYRVDLVDLENDKIIQVVHRLHPATSRFLREWLATHPQIMKHLH